MPKKNIKGRKVAAKKTKNKPSKKGSKYHFGKVTVIKINTVPVFASSKQS